MQAMLKEVLVVLFKKLQLYLLKVEFLHGKFWNKNVKYSDVGIWSDDQIPGLKRIVNVVHAHGGKIGIQVFISLYIIIQLAHSGRKGSTYAPGTRHGRQNVPENEGGWSVVGPSSTPYDENHGKPHALTIPEIKERIQAFVDAAKRAVAAGYDFIQIHAAHGYLIHEFLSPLSNQRDDEYGGNFENRTRFLKEIVKAIREVIPKEMPLFVRLSMSDFDSMSSWEVPEVARLSKELEDEYEVDMVNLSSGGLSPNQVIPSNWDFQLQMAKTIKDQTGIVCSAVGGVCNAETASRVVDEWKIEVVEIGKATLRGAFNPRCIAVDLKVIILFDISFIATYSSFQRKLALGKSYSCSFQVFVCLFL